MLHRRYNYDKQSILELNDLQVRLRDQVAHKVDIGSYNFEDVECCVCKVSQTELLAKKDRYGLKLSVVICKNCGLIFTNPRMNQNSYARFYDSEYRDLYHGYKAPFEDLFDEQLIRAGKITRFLSEISVNFEGKHIFEVGCGAGGILEHFRAQYNCQVAGCDFGSEGVRYGVEKHLLHIQEGDLENIRLQWKPDIIIYSHVFEHIVDLNKECQKIRACLGENGGVYIEIPSVKNIRLVYKWDFLRLLQNAHTYHFTLRTLRNVMEKNGFAFVGGNEFAQAYFVKGALASSIENDYDNVMNFLKRTEFLRPFRRVCKYMHSLKTLGISLLGKYRIRGIANNVFYKS
jgi:SAM-dependent methyltransferase